MEKYLSYSLEQLIWDKSFREIILDPSPAQKIVWEKCPELYPGKVAVFLEAAEIIRSVQPVQATLSEKDRKKAVSDILAKTTRKPVAKKYPFTWPVYLRAAASVVLMLGLFWWAKRSFSPAGNPLELAESLTVQQKNVSSAAQLIRLEDGSAVILSPGSRIVYPKTFDIKKREIKLIGEGFFEISRDTSRPFFVYAGQSVTRVLGTSFMVRAFEKEEKVTVNVHTGKVAVYYQNENHLSPANLLERNEQIVFHKQDLNFEKSMTPASSRYSDGPAVPGDQGAEMPVTEMLSQLQKFYGVSIQYDQQQLKDCSIMANIDDLHLLEKLDAICLAINATYTIREGKIWVSGKGC